MKEVVFIDVDTQVDFIRPKGKLYVPGAEAIIANLKTLTRIAAENDILIISSVDTHIKNDPEFRQFPRHCLVGSKGQKKIPQTLLKNRITLPERILDRRELFSLIKSHRQIITPKNTYDAFMDLNLFRLLKPFSRALVYGVALDYCVRAAVRDLLAAGLEVSLVVDAVKPIDLNNSRVLLSGFKKSGVKLLKTGEVLSEIKELAK